MTAYTVVADEDGLNDTARFRNEVRNRVEQMENRDDMPLMMGDIDAPRPLDPNLRDARQTEREERSEDRRAENVRTMEERHDAMSLTAEERTELMKQAEERRMEREKEAEERRAEVQNRFEERQQNRVEFQKETAERRVENAKRVISATIERLLGIADRVESRIEKVSEAGGDTATAETYLSAARADLEAAKSSVIEFDNLDLSSDDAQVNFELIRVAAEEAKAHIRSAHKNLADSVSSFNNSDN